MYMLQVPPLRPWMAREVSALEMPSQGSGMGRRSPRSRPVDQAPTYLSLLDALKAP